MLILDRRVFGQEPQTNSERGEDRSDAEWQVVKGKEADDVGCICCTLRADLLEEIANLAEKGEFEYVYLITVDTDYELTFSYLIIESSGISEPIQVSLSRNDRSSELITSSGCRNLYISICRYSCRLDCRGNRGIST